MIAPCRHPAFTTARNARCRAYALQLDPALRPVPVECRYCGMWRLEKPGSSYFVNVPRITRRPDDTATA